MQKCDEKHTVRVAAYCRVSTDKDDQVNSLESQKRYFAEYIRRNPEWVLAEVYADEGVTGTSTKKRHEFNRMIDDASKGLFDIIITKEISRFARNTLDSIYYTRELKKWGVGVIFMNDNINTLDADAELRLTIMSSIAQEESRKTSDRVKWGQKRSMEQGIVFGRNLLGYDVRGGKLYINDDGANTVRLIFHKFVTEEKGTHVIARELREAGIATASNMKEWSNAAILRILKNEKYCGDLIQKKTYTPSYLDHEKRYNHGEEDYVIIRKHHEPIITRELFEKANAELMRRSAKSEHNSKHSNRYCFSGKIRCGMCGKGYVSLTKKRHDGSTYKAWRCAENAKNGSKHIDTASNCVGCDNISVNDDAIKEMLISIMQMIYNSNAGIVSDTLYLLDDVQVKADMQRKDAMDITKKISDAENKRRLLVELYLNGDISKNDFKELVAKYDKLVSELKALNIKNDESRTDIKEALKDTVQKLLSGVMWDDVFYRNILESITVENGCLRVRLEFCDEELVFVYR